MLVFKLLTLISTFSFIIYDLLNKNMHRIELKAQKAYQEFSPSDMS